MRPISGQICRTFREISSPLILRVDFRFCSIEQMVHILHCFMSLSHAIENLSQLANQTPRSWANAVNSKTPAFPASSPFPPSSPVPLLDFRAPKHTFSISRLVRAIPFKVIPLFTADHLSAHFRITLQFREQQPEVEASFEKIQQMYENCARSLDFRILLAGTEA